ncbi:MULTISPECIES: DUF58 domain-containing protein [unclassified Curtobacterium]|uniref:DUF58 domain-containing protein n=1 Tax=unclassified Curtobacterium TaxID=257496 RepID=UPI000DA78786|nr:MULTISPECIES: DUF58 domain-containing protein [unclassified Curtobacterium]PZE28852.1 DUF58 domain-containing protein [Curtobacterium sp. MCBD17_028]PZE77204.1 DUF58 domain-containing protein [Curtobacterium sp. MCBD17_019]PZF59114.1 DUF58 domain-containing protein [Curtobacterium sp. MCBD17_034]PZM34343.1 DUF58 domain-containing protein [Curtobacterium sp. MCBD17_031]WIE53326.1 DUF58 domain-containing protein [Curtobacterium sp. MCBD17_003]
MTDRATRDRAPTGTASRRPGGTRSRRPGVERTATLGATNARTHLVGGSRGGAADAVAGAARLARAVGRLGARVGGQVASVVTGLGWTVAVLTAVALVLGYRYGLREVVAVGWTGVVLAVVALVALVGRSRLAVRMHLPTRRVAVGGTATVRITAENPGRVPTVATSVEVPVGPGLVDVALPGIAPQDTVEREVPVPTLRRGVLDVGPVRGVRADPVGLVRREVVWTQREQVIVHPRTIAIPSTSTGLVRDLEGQVTRDLSPADIAFHAIREYQPGDDPRTVHWKSTAKTGALMVRQFEETRRSHLVVALGTARSEFGDDDEFELAVSAAASLGDRAIRDGREVTVVVSARTPEFARRRVYAVHPLTTRSPSLLLDDFARVAASDASLPTSEVARIVGDDSVGTSVAFLVVGSAVGLGALRLAATRFPVGVEVVAVICETESPPRVVRVPGLTVITIGYLEDLRHALRRSAAA